MNRPSVPTLTPEQEARLWRRIDLRLMPIITLMYLLSFMDRGCALNVIAGNAKLDGLTTQLNLTGNKYNIALVTSSSKSFDPPGKLMALPYLGGAKRGRRWLPGIMVGLALRMSMGFVRTYPQLVGVRVCLGVVEAGLYPGVAYYLTMWYPKYMYQFRLALFSGSATLAGAFSGLLAFAINYMNGDGGLEGWSWIFLLEGIATVVIAFIGALVMVDYPSTAMFLTPEERVFVVQKQSAAQLRCDAAKEEEDHVARQVWAAFTDWQVWAMSVVQLSIILPLYGITYFLPFGYSTSISQLLTVPPYVFATITLLTFSYFSDKLKLRSPFIFAAQLIALVGYIINITDAPSGVKYFGTFLCIIGSYTAFPGSISLLANNLGGRYKRAVGMALQITAGNLGGAAACNIYRTQDEPRYILGHGLAITFISIGLVALPITILTYKRINSQRDRAELLGQSKGEKAETHEGEEAEEELKFDRALSFRYTI
ncbi:hypothetical protein HYDPIDRAFT_132016 [Hydnomerulius pinastri MD-312]|uniref:Major facilitator superfamily (MFS) profile domain-containing protein n=1 Tax=Hydnomerulius pinastri MD-312 TaxID=994086 RepID=A0A0C9VGX5_9AGAM|nr:hypothetical protein HYDPIDRAFT_132016 [Hydnomerulius pinastri MD-312]